MIVENLIHGQFFKWFNNKNKQATLLYITPNKKISNNFLLKH